MGRERIPIWLHTSVDDVFAGIVEVQKDGTIQFFFDHDENVVDFMGRDIHAGKLQAVSLHLEYADPAKPRTTAQIEYLEKLLPYTAGGKTDGS